MSDYYVSTGISRDQMAEALRENDEQPVYVLLSALAGGPVDEAVDCMTSPSRFSNADRDQVVANLQAIARAVSEEDYEEIPF